MKTKENSYPIQIHFKGETLDARSVPIYELGETLLAIQRLVQRAYLIASNNPQQRVIYHIATREKLALQLVKQEKGSDIYALDWFMKTVGAIPPEMIAKTLEMLFMAGMTIVTERLVNRKKELNREASLLLNDFLALANRVESVGKIDSIELHVKGGNEVITITRHTREYIERSQKEVVIGKDVEFKGTIETVNVASRQLIEALPENFTRRVRVIVINPPDFDMILETSAVKKKAVYKFKGLTQVKPGEDPVYFENFIAREITLYRGRKKGASTAPKNKRKKTAKPASKRTTRQVKSKSTPKRTITRK